MPGGNKSDSAGGRTQKFVVRNIAGDKRFTAERERIGEELAARAAAQGDSLLCFCRRRNSAHGSRVSARQAPQIVLAKALL